MVRAGRRLLSSLPALCGVLVFTFLLMRVLPGDPAVFFASGPNAGKEEIEAQQAALQATLDRLRREGEAWRSKDNSISSN